MSDGRRACGLAVVVLIAAMSVAGCGGGSNLPEITGSPSISLPSVSRTGSVPSRTASRTSTPEPSDSVTQTPSEEPTSEEPTSEEPTSEEPSSEESSSEEPSSEEVTRTATRTATEQSTVTVTASETATPSPSVTPSTSASPVAESDESSSAPWWLWLLLALVVVGGIVWALVAAASRRRWDAAFALALTEARWEADSLAPSLLDSSVSGDVLAERWRGNQRRLDEMETELMRLADGAPGAQRTARADRVSTAAVGLRQALAADVALRAGTRTATASQVDLAQSARVVENRSDVLLAAVDDRPDPTG